MRNTLKIAGMILLAVVIYTASRPAPPAPVAVACGYDCTVNGLHSDSEAAARAKLATELN